MVLPADDPLAAPQSSSRARDARRRVPRSTTGATASSSSPTATPPDFRVVTAPCTHRASRWTELVAARSRAGASRQVEPFAGHLAVHEWADGLEQLRVLLRRRRRARRRPSTRPSRRRVGANPEYETDALRFHYESLSRRPPSSRRTSDG